MLIGWFLVKKIGEISENSVPQPHQTETLPHQNKTLPQATLSLPYGRAYLLHAVSSYRTAGPYVPHPLF